MGVLGVAALGLANGDELVQGPGFQVIFGKRELTRRSAPAGLGEAGKHGRREGGLLRFASRSTYIPKNQMIVARKYVTNTVSNTDTPTEGS